MSLAEVRLHIDRHYARPLPVTRLARLAGLSTYYFIRAFRAETGQTPHQYVRDAGHVPRRASQISPDPGLFRADVSRRPLTQF
jgi:AraC-like DNA-binding protein